MAIRTHKNFIDGKWTASISGKTFESINPATEEIIGRFQSSVKEDVKKAVSAAERAYENWRKVPAPKRGDILMKAAQIMSNRKEELARLEAEEMGKVMPETRGDVQEAIDILLYMAGEGRRLFGQTTKSELPDKFAMTIRTPVGVCGLISPWNFPIAIPAWKLAPALICGNTAVFKPSSDTPLCALRFVEILTEAGVPPGVVNFVTGSGTTAGKEIVKNPATRCISFTGSRETGLWITQNSGIKKVGLELGGKNPVIIMDDADLSLALGGVLWGAFGTTGQRCTATSRVIVHEEVQKKFEKILVERAKKIRIGPGYDEKSEMGPLINRAALEKTQNYVKIGKEEKAKLICGGKPFGKQGFFHEPTIFSGVEIDMHIAQEEIFGPVLSIITCLNIEEAIEKANKIDYGLSSAIYTNDVSNAFKAIEDIEAGLTYVNSSTIGSEVHLPFGGMKQTGNCREAGIFGIDEFSEIKTVYIDYSGKLQKAQIDLD